MTDSPLRVLVWNENIHESTGDEKAIAHYPDGIHTVIADGLRSQLGAAAEVATATLQEPEHGLTQEVVDRTDVLLWWGHAGHDQVADEVVDRVHEAVLGGMGLLVLHSGHYSKIFKRLMGTTCSLKWRNDGERELVWTVAPRHPIAEGVPHPIVIPEQEMYGEFFDIPAPDETVFLSTFEGGEVFRSGVTYSRGMGRVFYFSPGDQEFPVYHHADVQRVLANGVRWAAGSTSRHAFTADYHAPGWFEG
ncbi:MAG TPA: ThuA domain-containing protein [Microbacterium sp.]|nr:ThuA domain-containing protein [Microbacterium sp.]